MNSPPSYHIKRATCRQTFWTKHKQMQQQPFAPRYASEKIKPSNQFILFYEAPRSMLKALVADIQSHFSVHTLSLSHAERLSASHSLALLQSHTHILTLASWVENDNKRKENMKSFSFIHINSIRFFLSFASILYST